MNLFFTAISKNYAAEIRKDINRFKIEEEEKKFPEIEVIVSKGNRITTETKQLKPIKLSVEENYNDDFLEEHKIISQRLVIENDKGIILLHGEPGTGKTTYIKYLSGILKKTNHFYATQFSSFHYQSAVNGTYVRLLQFRFDY